MTDFLLGLACGLAIPAIGVVFAIILAYRAANRGFWDDF